MNLFQRLGAATWLALFAAASVAQAADAMWIARSVHGYRVSLAVESERNADALALRGRHAKPAEHRVTVVFRNEATGRAVDLVQASVDTAEKGYSGASVPLEKDPAGARGLYEARIPLAAATDYRILVRATPAGGKRSLEAQFEYRHHH